MWKKVKRISKYLLLVLLLYLIWEWKVVWYGINQGVGQAKVILNAQEVEDFLDDPEVADSVKYKLQLIQEIKRFTVDSLAFDESGSYQKMYDQKGKPILWVVTASRPFKLEAYEWSFSFLGNFSYKGHFERQKVEADSTLLAQEGYDVEIDEVSAWSTLGWLDDPILSSMLDKSEGSIANLIIHELMHGTLYVKSDVDFNENLANFVGHKGALQFLRQKWGEESKQYKEYMDAYQDRKIFYKYILKKVQELDELYNSESFEALTHKEKLHKKEQFIEDMKEEMSHLDFRGKKYSCEQLEEWHPNNAYFIGYLMYNAEQEDFEEEYQKVGNLKDFVQYLKEKYNTL